MVSMGQFLGLDWNRNRNFSFENIANWMVILYGYVSWLKVGMSNNNHCYEKRSFINE